MSHTTYNKQVTVGSTTFDKVFDINGTAIASRVLNFKNRMLGIDDSEDKTYLLVATVKLSEQILPFIKYNKNPRARHSIKPEGWQICVSLVCIKDDAGLFCVTEPSKNNTSNIRVEYKGEVVGDFVWDIDDLLNVFAVSDIVVDGTTNKLADIAPTSMAEFLAMTLEGANINPIVREIEVDDVLRRRIKAHTEAKIAKEAAQA